MKITILGCGGSMGVPWVGGHWGACNPDNTKNKRLRSSILIQQDNTTLLVDTGPDLRQQLLSAQIDHLDAVLYTHAHADHIHGLNDLRPFCLKTKRPIDIYGDATTLEAIHRFFPIPFAPVPKDKPLYKLHLYPHVITDPFDLGPFHIRAFPQNHGYGMTSLGYHINNVAYSTDVWSLSGDVLDSLKNKLDLWIVDCYRHEPHSTHSHVAQTLDWINYVKPKQAILTHLSEELDYDTLKASLPDHVVPAFDGLVITSS